MGPGRLMLRPSCAMFNVWGVAKKHLGIRAEEETIDRLNRVAAAMTVRASGAEVNMSDAARVVLLRGLDVLEAELGIVDTKGGKAASKLKR